MVLDGEVFGEIELWNPMCSELRTPTRFKTLTWVIGVGFVVLTSPTTLFDFNRVIRAPAPSREELA